MYKVNVGHVELKPLNYETYSEMICDRRYFFGVEKNNGCRFFIFGVNADALYNNEEMVCANHRETTIVKCCKAITIKAANTAKEMYNWVSEVYE